MTWLKNKNLLIISYKLLGDVFFLLSLFFALALAVDGLIPGLITDHVSFLRLILLLVFNLAALYAIGNLAGIKFKQKENNKKTIVFLSVMAAIFIFNSLFKLNPYLAATIVALVILAGYFSYKNFFAEK